MAQKDWPAGVIRKTPVVPEGSFQESKAPGVWSLEQVNYWKKQGQWPIAGNEMASVFIENLFSTWLYTGNGNTNAQAITNSIDLSGKGGMVWIKRRDPSTFSHYLTDTARGAGNQLSPNTTDVNSATGAYGISFRSTGFNIGTTGTGSNNGQNFLGGTFASWTFRKQPKFFDVVTYTGDGVAGRQIPHSLGVAPGMVIVKRTDATSDWPVYHRGMTDASYRMFLNYTNNEASQANVWNSTAPTGSVFSVGTNADVNATGGTYVAYLFAHDAGGFGLSGTENVISCGSYTGNGSTTGPVVTLGWEPQWLMIKNASGTGNWNIIDNMRGMPVGATDATLQANLSNAESSADYVSPTATGFQVTSTSSEVNTSTSTYIYIAIRRGPMKVPTDGTKVFKALNKPSTTTSGVGFPADLGIVNVGDPFYYWQWNDRLRYAQLYSDNTGAENSRGTYGTGPFDVQDGFKTTGITIDIAWYWAFRRAPGFFDVVCYTGAGSPQVVNHNLGVVPEFAILRDRTIGGDWRVYSATLGVSKLLNLQTTGAAGTVVNYWGDGSTITATQFNVSPVSNSGSACVGYLFASCPGVSKVGSYTGTGTTQQINCGFTAGARFVLIKRTDSTGDWYVWDSARGIVAGNDPYLLLNSTAAEVTSTDYIDTYSAGFEISSTAPAAINASGGTFIYLAIA